MKTIQFKTWKEENGEEITTAKLIEYAIGQYPEEGGQRRMFKVEEVETRIEIKRAIKNMKNNIIEFEDAWAKVVFECVITKGQFPKAELYLAEFFADVRAMHDGKKEDPLTTKLRKV